MVQNCIGVNSAKKSTKKAAAVCRHLSDTAGDGATFQFMKHTNVLPRSRRGGSPPFWIQGSDYMHRATESLLRSCFGVHACLHASTTSTTGASRGFRSFLVSEPPIDRNLQFCSRIEVQFLSPELRSLW